jgi:D-arabinose 1-dehydrogenase-like Zn-dependent alcohol dehydrogenase
MEAVVLERFGGPEVLTVGEAPTPRPGADEVLVAVSACGVCGHDLLARSGALGTPLPMVIGHEIAGVVVEVGPDVHALQVGQRVVLVQRIPCGRCRVCRRGATNLCRQGQGFYGEDHTGGYGTYVVATERNAVALPEGIPDVVGAILSCGVGTGLRALRTAGAAAGDLVLVTGAGGGVGLHTVAVAAALGCRVIAASGSPSKIEALLEAGAEEVIGTLSPTEMRETLKRRSDGWGADVVIEVTGPPTFASSLAALSPAGRMVIVGNTVPGTVELNPGRMILQELKISGSAHATRADLEEVVAMVSQKRISPAVGLVLPLERASELHEAMEARRVAGRGVLRVAGR